MPNLIAPVSITDQFRKLKVGKSLTMKSTHYQAPHSFARAAGIKVATEVVKKLKAGFVLKVTRIADEPAKV